MCGELHSAIALARHGYQSVRRLVFFQLDLLLLLRDLQTIAYSVIRDSVDYHQLEGYVRTNWRNICLYQFLLLYSYSVPH